MVFVGLMTAAGVIWGILEAAFFTRGPLTFPLDPAQSHADWVFPPTLALVLFGVWLAAKTVLRDPWKSIRPVLLTYPFVLCVSIATLVASALSCLDEAGAFAVWLSPLLTYGVLGLVYLVATRPRHRPSPRERRKMNWRSFFIFLAILGGSFTLLWAMFRQQWDSQGFYDMFSLCGFSLVLAWMNGRMDLLDFPQWLLRASAMAAAIGAVTGVFAVPDMDAPGGERRMVKSAGGALLLSVTVSGVAFAAHAFLLLYAYRAAWDGGAILAASVVVWGTAGAIGGLSLVAAVEYLSASLARRRIRSALALAIVPLAAASIYAFWFVRTSDAGRALLIQAQKLEGRTYSINFWPDPYVGPAIYDGRRLIRVRRTDESDQGRQRRSYSHTIGLCDELLARFPRSAYRSAALYLKYEAMSLDWRPREALETRARLFALYPRAHYQEWAYPRLELYDRMLVGAYGDVVRLSRSYAKTQKRFPPSRAEACAAEVLGMWDDLIRIQRARMADFRARGTDRSPTYHQIPAKWEAEIKRAESMKAKGVGPRPRTDVSGRVLLGGKGLSGVTFCVLPVRDTPREIRDMTPSYAAAIGGRVAETDASGAYTIQRVPSGRYEVLLVLDPSASSTAFKVSAPGVPYDIKGPSVRLPDIVLSPSPVIKP